MPLKDFSDYVYNSMDTGLVKSNINSRYLLDLYQAWERNNIATYLYMQKDLLKRVES